jgi:integrase
MTQIRLKYVHEFADRHGKVRRYVRLPGGRRLPLHGRPGSAEFMAAYQAALDGIATPAAKKPIGATRTLSGSIDAAIVGWYGHESFTSLARTSRDTRRQSLELFRKEHGTKPIAALRSQHINSIIAAMKLGSARQMLYALKALCHFAALTGLIADDPAAALKPPRKTGGKSDGIHSWTEDEIAAYRAFHAVGSTARLALELALNTAARRSDLVKIGPQHIRNGLFTYTQQKTGSPVAMPVHPDLFTVLAASPTNALFLVTSTGTQFSPDGLGNRFREWCRDAGIPGCSLHGLRKAQARRLAEAGCSAHEIASITGHQTLAEVQRYADAADRGRMAKAAMASVSKAFGRT